MKNIAVSPNEGGGTYPSWKKDTGILVLKLILIWLSWKIFIWIMGEESEPLDQRMFPALSAIWESLNDALRITLLSISRSILTVLGYRADVFNDYTLMVHGHPGISVGNYCLGFQLMYYFAMLFLVSGLPRKKMWFGVITGILLIQLLNILRLVGLSLIDVHAPQLMFVSHDYLFSAFVFIVLILFYYKLVKH